MKSELPEQLENMDRDALEAALSRVLLKLQESDQRQRETQDKLGYTQNKLSTAEKQLNEALLEVELLKEIIRLKSRLPFIPSTEQMAFLFDESELLSTPPSEEEQDMIEVPSHQRSRKSHDLTTLPADTPVVDIHHRLEEAPVCGRCGSTTEYTEDRIVLKVAVQPKKYYIEAHHFPSTVCSSCEADEGEKNITTHWEHKSTDSLIATASLVADCATRKYADALPLYRQEAIFRREGFNVSRQTISNWLLTYMGLLRPLRDRFKTHIFNSALINQDETPLRVLHLPEPASSKSTFMFVQVGSTLGEGSEHRIVLYTYIRNRKKETLQSFTQGYNGYVMTDGLKGYLGSKNHLNCWVHAQRGFKEIVKSDRKAAGAVKFISIINGLFDIEKTCRKRYPERNEFLIERKKRAQEVFAELEEAMEDARLQYATKSPMGKAISYLYTYWDTLIAYVDCYESSAHNNIAENAIRPFVIGRKGWLFSNTETGAHASAFYYSLVETAKANGINVYDYLWYCLSEAPKCRTESDWDALLPWNMDSKKTEQLKAIRNSATPDPTRKTPYVLRGAN
jgi:transposase